MVGLALRYLELKPGVQPRWKEEKCTQRVAVVLLPFHLRPKQTLGLVDCSPGLLVDLSKVAALSMSREWVGRNV